MPIKLTAPDIKFPPLSDFERRMLKQNPNSAEDIANKGAAVAALLIMIAVEALGSEQAVEKRYNELKREMETDPEFFLKLGNPKIGDS